MGVWGCWLNPKAQRAAKLPALSLVMMVWGSGFGVYGVSFTVYGAGFSVWGEGFRV